VPQRSLNVGQTARPRPRPKIVARTLPFDWKGKKTGVADPAFTENRAQGIHRWVPWIAGFSAAFVAETIDKHAPDGGLIVDPFAGVGTTLLETIRRGVDYEAIGFEINPYAAFVAEAKLLALRQRVKELRRMIAQFRQEAPTASPAAEPEGFRSRIPFYSPRVLEQVLRAMGWIHRVKSVPLRRLFLTAFGSVMVKFSNYSYEPSLTSRPGVGKDLIEDADVYATIREKLEDMADDIACFQLNDPAPAAGAVHSRSWAGASEVIEEDSVQLIVTSPPYANNYHYLRNTRPHLYWLGFARGPDDLKSIEQASFGKFWQTVRDLPPIHVRFDLPELEAQLGELRTLNAERGHYGGAGWANYLVTYFNDSYEFLKTMARLLGPGGVAVIVIGNSIVQGMEIRTDEVFAHLAESDAVRLTVESLEVARNKRVGNSIINSSVRRGSAKTASLYESVLTLRR